MMEYQRKGSGGIYSEATKIKPTKHQGRWQKHASNEEVMPCRPRDTLEIGMCLA